jgi:hypothetical protein
VDFPACISNETNILGYSSATHKTALLKPPEPEFIIEDFPPKSSIHPGQVLPEFGAGSPYYIAGSPVPKNLKNTRFCLKPHEKMFPKMAFICRKHSYFLHLCPDSRKTITPYMAENR